MWGGEKKRRWSVGHPKKSRKELRAGSSGKYLRGERRRRFSYPQECLGREGRRVPDPQIAGRVFN